VHALVQGIPVHAGAPHWICDSASLKLDELLKPAHLTQEALRLWALQRMAWAQWTVDEIASGVPFDHLLRHARQG
jgi:hypothetical protein